MAYKTGKANGYKDMLLALKGFLENAKKAYNCQPGSNTGDGYVSAERASTSPVDETWTLTATSSTNFTVTGSVSGSQAAATVGTPYDNGIVAFTIIQGSIQFVSGDSFTFQVADGLGTTEKWTVKSWDTDWNGNGDYELIIMAPGSSGEDEIYVGIQTYFNAGGDYYNWRLQGYTGYSTQADFGTQPGAIPDLSTNRTPSILLWDNELDYWLVANGRRYVLVVKVSTVYELAYQGFLMPYGLPNQIPYPIAVGGTCPAEDADQKRWSSIDYLHRAFFDPAGDVYTNHSTLKILHGSWLGVNNWQSETVWNVSGLNVWPYMHSDYSSSPYFPPNRHWAALEMNLDGSYPLFPIIICGDSPHKNFYGEFQGLFAVPGEQIAAEDKITISGTDYIVFQNCFRTSPNDYCALKLE
ncbi:MAG: hypothetical protein ACFFCW_00615 [Candidatus Hodarchaeota archaeon]